tara:strand:- start:620 stop:817 length:198 start_codon:yes stop_codon:yes gene_type:complete
MNIGSLVRRKMYSGVQGSLQAPAYYGFITKVYPNRLYRVVFVLRDGSLLKKDLSAGDLVLVTPDD